MAALEGWNLWELDSHHGEKWHLRLSITTENPTFQQLRDLSETGGWALFKSGLRPEWEDGRNVGRLKTSRRESDTLPLVKSIYHEFNGEENVSGIFFHKKKVFSLWLGTADSSLVAEIKSRFIRLYGVDENEIIWEDFKNDRSLNKTLHLHDVVWKYGKFNENSEEITRMSVYDIDAVQASPDFVINYKRDFYLNGGSWFLVETELHSSNLGDVNAFVTKIFALFRGTKSSSLEGIAEALAIQYKKGTTKLRFYTYPMKFCKKNYRYSNCTEVLIMFGYEWKTKILTLLEPAVPELEFHIFNKDGVLYL